MRFGVLLLGLTTLTLAAQPLDAQSGRDNNGRRARGPERVPPGHLPAPGECRVWVDGVPPGRQAAPTDCATARRDAARSGGRVIYGDDRGRRDDRDRDDRDDRDYRDDREDRDAGDWCLDRDRDGVCDSAENRSRDDSPWRFPSRRDDTCVDRNRDGRCDVVDTGSRTGSVSLPDGRPRMSAALEFDRGVRSSEVVRWVGSRVSDVRITRFLNRPVTATFYDREGRILQRWKKQDDQGRMREIELYEGGRLVRTVSR